MGASGDFGDDPTVGGKDVYLGDDDITKNMAAVLDDGGGSFVAG